MEIGDFINNTYRIIKPIGNGGIGEIYKAYHENLKKYVVVKKIKDTYIDVMNLRIEVDILKGLHHTYLPQVYDFIQIGSQVFTVMDYISGRDLQAWMNRGVHFQEEQLILWMTQLCEVLEYLHTRNPQIIHCDIKPANIMITDEGNVCLIDFNISLDGENNKELVGLSSQFASPEQARKAEIKKNGEDDTKIVLDPRSDIYSLGAVFYYLMTSILPCADRKDFIDICEIDHGYSDSLENIVSKAMQEDISRRFRSAHHMHMACQNLCKWSDEFLRLIKMERIINVGFGILAVFFLCFAIVGYRGMKTDDFFQSYERYMLRAEEINRIDENEDLERIIQTGIQLLNESDNEKFFQKYLKEKSNVLYAISQGYLLLEEYEFAVDYLEKAVSLNIESADMYRDLAIAQAYCGYLEEAKLTILKAVRCGLSETDADIVNAELAYWDGDYEQAYMFAAKSAESDSVSVSKRAALIIGKSADRIKNNKKCIEFLIKTAKTQESYQSTFWYRQAGVLCLKKEKEEQSDIYLEKAVECFEKIKECGYAQLSDLYNLASAYEKENAVLKCLELLKDMEQIYPKEYEVPMRIAYVYYKMENDKGPAIRDYQKVATYYSKAEKICVEQGYSVSEDENMIQLQEILIELRNQGWINKD